MLMVGDSVSTITPEARSSYQTLIGPDCDQVMLLTVRGPPFQVPDCVMSASIVAAIVNVNVWPDASVPANPTCSVYDALTARLYVYTFDKVETSHTLPMSGVGSC